jgi:hypothetical protein
MRKTLACGRFCRWAIVLVALCVAGCSSTPTDSTPQQQVEKYFGDNNAAAERGPQAQREFLRQTQHPDFAGLSCDLGNTTVQLDPALSTLRRDPEFRASGTPPRGETWAVAVEVTTRRDGSITGRQIGSQHLVLLDGRIYGFAPCSNGG